MNNVLSLSFREAREFFLKEKSYINFDLPPYFKFSDILKSISKEIEERSFTDYFSKNKKPRDCEAVNYKIFDRKDGKYGWRPLQIVHPVLYVSLVHRITEEENWSLLQNRFESFKEKNCVECMSLPIVSEGEQADKGEQVINWWKRVEQKSIASGLKYKYFFETDIGNCYGSIYTHSVSWSLHDKDIIKEGQNRKDNNLIGNVIDVHLQEMSCGHTNGIPQGSTLMDFIAEMVLIYVDYFLTNRLESDDVKEGSYEIIRYRDDYRIFVNNPQIGEKILKILSEVLSSFGMAINTHKTKYSDELIRDSIKPDKLYYITYGKRFNNIQKELLLIHSLARKFPDSGTICKKLDQLSERLRNQKDIGSDPYVLISIIVDIALSSPRAYPVISAVMSEFLNHVKNKNKKKQIIKEVIEKFRQIPNTGFLQLWLQRITIKLERDIDYKEKLCKVAKDPNCKIDIWNSDWLDSSKLKRTISLDKIIDESEISRIDPIIDSKEFALFRQLRS